MADRIEDMNVEAIVDLVERIMTQHWDLSACDCWVCALAREAGCRPRQTFLDAGRQWPRVKVGGPPPEDALATLASSSGGSAPLRPRL